MKNEGSLLFMKKKKQKDFYFHQSFLVLFFKKEPLPLRDISHA
jgi:hypothetical protein